MGGIFAIIVSNQVQIPESGTGMELERTWY